jgi:hypothetical protein
MDVDATAPAPSRSATTERRFGILGTGKRAQQIVLAIALIFLLIMAFFGGRAYQNNIDQKLFNAYSPPNTATGGSAFGGRGGLGGAATGNSSLVNAALGVGTPPGSTSGAGSNNAGSSSNFGFGANSAGGAGGAAQANRVSGTLASVSATTLTVTSFSGLSQSVAVNHATRFYQSKTATASDLKAGSPVTILAAGSGNKLTATSISIGSQAGTSGGGRFGGGGIAAGGLPTTTIKGKIAHASAGSITLVGRSAAISMAGTTRLSQVVSIPAPQLSSGSFVSANVATVGGKMVATSVVARSGGFGAPARGG